jgi:hypothetical protein
VTAETWAQVGVTLIGWVALVATMRSKITDHDSRIVKLETNQDNLKTDFVPRPEIQVQLSSLKESNVRIEALLNAVLYSSKANIQVNGPR